MILGSISFSAGLLIRDGLILTLAVLQHKNEHARSDKKIFAEGLGSRSGLAHRATRELGCLSPRGGRGQSAGTLIAESSRKLPVDSCGLLLCPNSQWN